MISEIQQVQASLYVMGSLSDEEALSFEAGMNQSAALKAEATSLNNGGFNNRSNHSTGARHFTPRISALVSHVAKPSGAHDSIGPERSDNL